MKNLKMRLAKNGMKQVELARKLDVSKAVVYNWVKNDSVPKKYQNDVDEILGVDVPNAKGRRKLIDFIEHNVPNDIELEHIVIDFYDDGQSSIFYQPKCNSEEK